MMKNFVGLMVGAVASRIRRLSRSIRNEPDLDYVNDWLAVGGSSDYNLIPKAGIEAVLDLRAEAPSMEREADRLGLYYKRVGILDGGTPTIDQVREAVDWVIEQRRMGRRVLIHCNLGRGRAPLMTSIVLATIDHMGAEALKAVERVRPYIYLNGRQRSFVSSYLSSIDDMG